jgi:hypothetical protein
VLSLVTYSDLYESMATWYRRWYLSESHVRLACATGLALCVGFNVFLLVNVAALLGSTKWLSILGGTRYAPVAVLAALWIINVSYAFQRTPQTGARATAKLALWYVAASFAALVLSFALLVALRPPPFAGR